MTVHSLSDTETDPAAALAALGLTLPEVVEDPKYLDWRASADGRIHLSGQLPYVDGKLPVTGAVGDTVDVDTARAMMVRATLNALAVGADAAGALERLRIVHMLAFVLSAPGFADQSRVADAGSELLVQVLGEHGRHARTAIGVAGLPRNSPVEVQLVCEVRR
ncbi:MAG TPA: RidA family protein [Flexivirga sp.]|uniref:RidA family protein n=1 Tax=Flexivirga sp. TaxID=1962927 RepID=UPI002CD64A74|nr:RidA family protein [Flexivirga sp.]HWC21384.1 RidA family protein [Flexivirga sp.]